MNHHNTADWMLAVFALWALAGQHFFIHHLGGVGLDLPLNAQAWVMVALLLLVGGCRAPMVVGRWWPFLAVGALLLWLPWFYSHAEPTRLAALPRLLGLMLGVLFYWGLLQAGFSERRRLGMLMLLLGLASVQMLFALGQFFLLDEPNWFRFNTRVRLPYGLFLQRNVMASLMASAVLLALYLLAGARAGGRLRLWCWCLPALAAGIVLVVLLQSRAGVYSLLAGLLLMLPVCWIRLSSRFQRGVMLGMVLLALVAGLALLLQLDLHKRMLAVYGELGVRAEIWHTTLGLIAQHVWLGVGYGGFESAYYAEAGRLLALGGAVPQMPPGLHHPHNEVLLWLVEGGVVTLLAWGVWGWGALLLLRRLPWSERLALVALCLPIVVHLMSEYPFEHSVVHWLWLLVVMWYFDSATGLVCCHLPRGYSVINGFTRGVGIVLLVFMVTGLHSMYQLTRYERGGFAEPRRLDAVVNPWIWSDRLQLYRHALLLENGLRLQDEAMLQRYVDWSAPVLARLPRIALWHNHLVALLALGREQEALSLAGELRLRYPRVAWFSGPAMQALQERLRAGSKPVVHRHLSQPAGSATYYGHWVY